MDKFDSYSYFRTNLSNCNFSFGENVTKKRNFAFLRGPYFRHYMSVFFSPRIYETIDSGISVKCIYVL